MPATPTRSRYLTVGGLVLATRAINAYDFADLYASPAHRADDYVVPGQDGVVDRTRVRDALRAVVSVRIDGRYDHDTDATVADAEAGVFAAWQKLHDVADVVGTQTVTLTVGGATAASAGGRVLELTAPRQLTPYLWDARLDLLLPNGSLL